jgi:energy-converting hydrogenase Eha subunit F
MGFVFPDPDDRSKNSPAVLIQPEEILSAYLQAYPDNTTATAKDVAVHNWFANKAIDMGWKIYYHAGNQAILSMTDKMGTVMKNHRSL